MALEARRCITGATSRQHMAIPTRDSGLPPAMSGKGVWRQPRTGVIVRQLVAAQLDSEMTHLSAGPISMIRSAYASVRERSWNRDRSRRIDAMLRRERA